MMKLGKTTLNLLTILTLSLTNLMSYSILADTKSPTLNSQDRITLQKGKQFIPPKDGQFLSNEAVAKLLTEDKKRINNLLLEIDLLRKSNTTQLEYCNKECTIKLDSCESKLENNRMNSNLQKSIYDSAIDRTAKICERKWYESPIMTFAAGVALCGASVGVGFNLK